MADDDDRTAFDEFLAKPVPFHITTPSDDGVNWLVVEVRQLSKPLFVGNEEDAMAVAKALNERAMKQRNEDAHKLVFPPKES